MTKKIKIFLVDDHQIMIDGLKSLLHNDERFEITGEATTAKKALELIEKVTPEIMIVDINMPEISGIELTKMVKLKFPSIKIIALSMYNEKGMIEEMLAAGISGYILKNTGKEELCTALFSLSSGETYFSRAVAAEMMDGLVKKKENENNVSPLTPREKEIIQLISQEYSNEKIANTLFISERTVETHRKNIFRKTNTKSIVGLIKYAYENNLIS